MVASGTRHNGAAWRRHGRGLVARRAAMGRRAILRGLLLLLILLLLLLIG
jgi:hypothetical protein